jgi:hypothetical protein
MLTVCIRDDGQIVDRASSRIINGEVTSRTVEVTLRHAGRWRLESAHVVERKEGYAGCDS